MSQNPTDAEIRQALIDAGVNPDAPVLTITDQEGEHWSGAIVEYAAHFAGVRNIAIVARAEAPFVASHLRSGARDAALIAMHGRDCERLERAAPNAAAVLAAAMKIVLACAAVKAALDPSPLFADYTPAARLN